MSCNKSYDKLQKIKDEYFVSKKKSHYFFTGVYVDEFYQGSFY